MGAVLLGGPGLQSPNILLDKDWNAKIADTGLARTLFSKTHLSRTAPGRPHWIPVSKPAHTWGIFTPLVHLAFGQSLLQSSDWIPPASGVLPEHTPA